MFVSSLVIICWIIFNNHNVGRCILQIRPKIIVKNSSLMFVLYSFIWLMLPKFEENSFRSIFIETQQNSFSFAYFISLRQIIKLSQLFSRKPTWALFTEENESEFSAEKQFKIKLKEIMISMHYCAKLVYRLHLLAS